MGPVERLVAVLEDSFTEDELVEIAQCCSESYGKRSGPSKLVDVLFEQILDRRRDSVLARVAAGRSETPSRPAAVEERNG